MAEVGLDIQGFAWPFKFGPLGHANRSSGLARIKQNLEGIIMTKRGERMREKAFGTVGHTLVFRNMTTARMGLVTGLVHEALLVYEPRVDIYKVTWERRDTQNGSSIYVTVPFALKETGEEDAADVKLADI